MNRQTSDPDQADLSSLAQTLADMLICEGCFIASSYFEKPDLKQTKQRSICNSLNDLHQDKRNDASLKTHRAAKSPKICIKHASDTQSVQNRKRRNAASYSRPVGGVCSGLVRVCLKMQLPAFAAVCPDENCSGYCRSSAGLVGHRSEQ